jgi:S1-C subfamily serine protease
MKASTTLSAALACAALLQPVLCGQDGVFDERAALSPVEKLVHDRLPSVVKVHGASGLKTIVPYASGVVVSEVGHVLTLDLVMVQPGQTRVVLADGSVHDAELLPPEPDLGVRLLKIDTSRLRAPLRPVPLSRDVPENGTFVVSLGNAFRLAEYGEKVGASLGVVNATTEPGLPLRHRLADVRYEGRLILTDAPNNPGQYGGGMFTLDGRFIGLNARVLEAVETNTLVSAAIPCADLIAYVDRFVHGKVPAVSDEDPEPAEPGYHGIRLFDQGGRRSPPAYIERIARGSPAAALGLRPDDLIVRVGDRSVRSCAEFAEAMARYAPGAQVELTYKRGDAVRRGQLTLTEARR